jgi:hypothetical protein
VHVVSRKPILDLPHQGVEQFFHEIPAVIDDFVHDGCAHEKFANGQVVPAGLVEESEVLPEEAGDRGGEGVGGEGHSGRQVFAILPEKKAILPIELLLGVFLSIRHHAPLKDNVDERPRSSNRNRLHLHQIFELAEALKEVFLEMGVALLPLPYLLFKIIEDVGVSPPHPLNQPGVPHCRLQIGQVLPEYLAAILVKFDHLEEDLVVGDGVDGRNGMVDLAVLNEVYCLQKQRIALHYGCYTIEQVQTILRPIILPPPPQQLSKRAPGQIRRVAL